MLHKENPKKIVVAVPVSSRSTLQKLQNSTFVDEVICLSIAVNFQTVGQFYKKLNQVDDAEVQTLLNKMTEV